MKLYQTMLAAAGALAAMASVAQAQQFDTGVYYTMTTEFRGPNMRLDVFNGGADNNFTHLTKAEDVSGQYWRLKPAENGYWRLTTMFRGNNMCLDVVNGGPRNNQTQLVKCGNFSGQLWQMRNDGKAMRLTTSFRGSDMCLDIINGGPKNNQPELVKCDNYSGQFWVLKPTKTKVE